MSDAIYFWAYLTLATSVFVVDDLRGKRPQHTFWSLATLTIIYLGVST